MVFRRSIVDLAHSSLVEKYLAMPSKSNIRSTWHEEIMGYQMKHKISVRQSGLSSVN
jgi:hypothetical protein